MALFSVPATRFDQNVAHIIERHADPRLERGAQILSWGGDEHLLMGAAVAGWLVARKSREPYRRLSNHFLLCTVATAILPHILKSLVDQERPDRMTIKGHLRGIPFSGNPADAFPSGHALHVGALMSVATLLPAEVRNVVWAAGSIIAGTRIVLLAHWISDVLVGLCLGMAVERTLRRMTKPAPIKQNKKGRTELARYYSPSWPT